MNNRVNLKDTDCRKVGNKGQMWNFELDAEYK